MSLPFEALKPVLEEPFDAPAALPAAAADALPYDRSLAEAQALKARPTKAGGYRNIARQHQKNRMTVWERIDVLADEPPMTLFQNWGPALDGASLVTAIIKVGGRDIAVYGHDFTVRAGSMDATNGKKLASLYQLAAKQGIPLIGLNDSAGAFVPAGVGGLDGYAEAFTALRKISGVVPSIMCMFGFNAGGGAYLPRQGSFVIQPNDTFFGLTGVGVVREVLGEDVTPDELGGPGVHGASGVADFTVEDEVDALLLVRRLLTYLPDNNSSGAPFVATSDPVGRHTDNLDVLFRTTFNSPSGFNTPFDIRLVIQEVCDHGDFLEVQPRRARSTVTAFGRLGGHVVGFVANNSAFSTGFIDVDAAYKNARFIRFCNLYNIPVVFMEDTTGFLPGTEQERRGVVQAGRAMLDAIVDLRTPRILVLVRNAFGGAYASFNNYATGADFVFALPTTRVAVMGPAGREFVYKEELAKLTAERRRRFQAALDERPQGSEETEARHAAERDAARWFAAEDAKLVARYEEEIMNPREALSLGSISEIVMPRDLRRLLADAIGLCMRHYRPTPMAGPQREFH